MKPIRLFFAAVALMFASAASAQGFNVSGQINNYQSGNIQAFYVDSAATFIDSMTVTVDPSGAFSFMLPLGSNDLGYLTLCQPCNSPSACSTFPIDMTVSNYLSVALEACTNSVASEIQFTGWVNNAYADETVTVTCYTGGAVYYQVLTVDPSGSVNGTTGVTSDYSGYGTVCTTTCTGDETCYNFTWIAGTQYVQFGLDACPANPTPVDVTISGQVWNTADPITITYLANGMLNTITSNPMLGDYSFTLASVPDSGSVYVCFDDCYGVQNCNYVNWDASSTNVTYDINFCQEIIMGDCDASFWMVPDSMYSNPGTGYIVYAGSNTASSWTWNFGDGGTSTQEWPTWTYAQEGTYTICLTVVCVDGTTSTSCYTFTIDANGNVGPGGAQQAFTLHVVPEFVTGVTEVKSNNGEMGIFPNPMNDNTRLTWNAQHAGNNKVQIFNTQGQCVYQGNYVAAAGKNALVVPTQDLTSGYYIVRLTDASGAVYSVPAVK